MTKGRPRNVAAAVRQRLQNLARERKEDFQLALSRYGLERLLHRIGQSPHRDRFVVKGAMLFHLWTDQEYQGVRVALQAKLERARIPVQIDIGFGDVITPAPQQVQYPSMLGFPTPVVSTYPRETVVAEKFQAMVMLGMTNSRMKDFFDLRLLSATFEFAGEVLAQAIEATFERRRTPLPETIPTALSADFYDDDSKQKQWKAFISKCGLATPPPLPDLIAGLRAFLLPPVEAIRTGQSFPKRWLPPGPWR